LQNSRWISIDSNQQQQNKEEKKDVSDLSFNKKKKKKRAQQHSSSIMIIGINEMVTYTVTRYYAQQQQTVHDEFATFSPISVL
jgi:hypothetical protein